MAVYTSTDPEMEKVTWSLSGTDAGDFSIGEDTGILSFGETPDFENPVDDDTNNVYQVTIIAADPTDTQADLSRATHDLMVTVKNVDEPGVIELSTLQPKEGFRIDADLTDPDGKESVALPVDGQDDDLNGEASWQWARSLNMDGPWTDIKASATATPPITSESRM